MRWGEQLTFLPAAFGILDALVALGFLGRERKGAEAINANTEQTSRFLDKNKPWWKINSTSFEDFQILARNSLSNAEYLLKSLQ